jgi:hypothetical protein
MLQLRKDETIGDIVTMERAFAADPLLARNGGCAVQESF